MILTIPYYDPTGKYNRAFQHQLETLESVFDEICLSVVPPTGKDNTDFIHNLRQEGCVVFDNEPNLPIGDHSRNALRLAIEQAQAQRSIFFGFLDRMLFDLETSWRTSFLQDIERYQAASYMIFERSQFAWSTHPRNYREMEQMVSQTCELLYGKFIELSAGAFILSPSTASTILSQSTSSSYEIWGEWILLAMKNNIPITTKRVDWLAWEDPYWEQVEPDILKRTRETSREEIVKRIKLNMPIMLMMTEERFRSLRARD